MFDDELDTEGHEWKCQACDAIGPVDDLSLCQDCSGKLDRDMIRQEAWDDSVGAFGLSPKQRDELRATTIKKHGAAFELIVPEPDPPSR